MIFVQFQDPWTHTPTVLPGMASHKPDVDETNEAFDLDDGLKQVGPPPQRFFFRVMCCCFFLEFQVELCEHIST